MTTLSTQRMDPDRHRIGRFGATVRQPLLLQQIANPAAARLLVQASKEPVCVATSDAFAQCVILNVSLSINETLID